MINFDNSTFVKSASKKQERPQEPFSEVLIVGKSNVGKSTLINSLTNKKSLAKTSSKPGHTKLLNYFNIDNKFYLVDAPGYGFAKGGVDLDKLFGDMMSDYFTDNSYLKGVLVLIDSRRELSENDIELIDFVVDSKIPFYIIATKVDKLNQSEKSRLLKRFNEYDFPSEEIVFTSSLSKTNLSKIKQIIEKII